MTIATIQPGSVDKYQTAAFDGNRSSVPRRDAFRPVTVKGFVDRVEIVADHRVVATHVHTYATGERVLDPLHFLAILETRPATLEHALVYRDWVLPPAFTDLRRDLETRLGVRAGVRQFIRVLQLLARHPLDRLPSNGPSTWSGHGPTRRRPPSPRPPSDSPARPPRRVTPRCHWPRPPSPT